MRWHEWRALLGTYVLPHRRLLAWLWSGLLVSTAFQVAAPQVVRAFIDRATGGSRGPVTGLAGLYVAAVLGQQAVAVATAWLGEQIGWLATNELRADLLRHCLDLGADFHTIHTPGELIERIDGDVDGLSRFFAEFVLTVVTSTLLLVGVVVVVWLRNPVAGVALAALAGTGAAVIVLTRRVAAGAWEMAREASAQLFGFLEERLSATVDVRSSGAEAHTLHGFYGLARDRTRHVTRARVRDAVGWTGNNCVSVAANALAFVLTAVLVRRGSLTLGGAFALYFYVQVLLQPLGAMGHQVEQLQQAIAGGRRVVALLAVRPTMVDGPGHPLPPGALAVALRQVDFGYGDDPAVLHALDLQVAAGRVLGVVGRTGSGKSTVARLVVRLHDPRRGTVEVGGVDVRHLTRSDLRRRVVLVTQEVHVLSATVRDNLTLFADPDDPATPDDATLLRAVAALGLDGWLRRLPDGLDTPLGEGAVGLSAGEAQLLAFARAFLADPSVVVLDEASSRLDPATEQILEGAVDRLLAGRTGIVIAHRLATLDRCDDVCVLEAGRVLEVGPRADLVADTASHFGALLRTSLEVSHR